ELESPLAEKQKQLYDLKTATLKNDFNPKTKLVNQIRIWFLLLGCLTVALAAGGRAWTKLREQDSVRV
ncbi:MAG: hypothetical protein Q8L64_00185, partial [bacterium]|nr:hypothetical protein [bacterium]